MANVFAAETGSEIIEDYGMYQHAKYPFAIADIDYLYRQGTTEGVLECKSTTYHKAGDYQNGRTPIHYEMCIRDRYKILRRQRITASWLING